MHIFIRYQHQNPPLAGYYVSKNSFNSKSFLLCSCSSVLSSSGDLSGLLGSAGLNTGARDGAYGVFAVFPIYAIIQLLIHGLLYKGVKDVNSTLFLPLLIVTMIEIVVVVIVIVAGVITAIYYTGMYHSSDSWPAGGDKRWAVASSCLGR